MVYKWTKSIQKTRLVNFKSVGQIELPARPRKGIAEFLSVAFSFHPSLPFMSALLIDSKGLTLLLALMYR